MWSRQWLTSDGNFLATGCAEGRVHVWDLKARKICATTPVMENSDDHLITVIDFDPNGKIMAYGDVDAVVRLSEFSSGKVTRTLPGHRGSIEALSYLDGGRKLASASEDGTVLIWDVRTGRGE